MKVEQSNDNPMAKSIQRLSERSKFDINLKLIEQEINSMSLRNVSLPLAENAPFLLSYQIRKLKIFLDILHEAKKENCLMFELIAGRKYEGRLRQIPFEAFLVDTTNKESNGIGENTKKDSENGENGASANFSFL
jgi:hypothetical protein